MPCLPVPAGPSHRLLCAEHLPADQCSGQETSPLVGAHSLDNRPSQGRQSMTLVSGRRSSGHRNWASAARVEDELLQLNELALLVGGAAWLNVLSCSHMHAQHTKACCLLTAII